MDIQYLRLFINDGYSGNISSTYESGSDYTSVIFNHLKQCYIQRPVALSATNITDVSFTAN